MRSWLALVAATLLPPALPGCGPLGMKGGEEGAGAPVETAKLDRYLDGYRLLQPERLPEAADVASGCDEATANAIGELEAGGAMVERTFETSLARKLECRWASDRPWIAACRFEKAEVPFGGGQESEAERQEAVALLRDRDWGPAAARFAFVQTGGLANGGDPPRWIATDTCEPFVFKAGDWEIDLRESVRRRGLGS